MASEQSSCFVMMPFGGNFDSYYREIIAPALSMVGLNPIRADEIFGSKPIIEDIRNGIEKARLVLADVSTRNANVNYELGMAHTLGVPTIIITNDLNDVPFDYRHLRVIVYDKDSVRWDYKLSASIQSTCKAVMRESGGVNSHHRRHSASQYLLEFMSRSQKISRYSIYKESTITCDTVFNCRIEQDWTVEAGSDLTHVRHKIMLDGPGQIQLERIFDPINGVPLDHVVEEFADDYLNYFILLKYLCPKGTTAKIKLQFFVEDYLFKLRDEGKAYLFHQSMQEGASKFGVKKEKYIFPNSPQFKSLRAVIRSHPDPAQIGVVVRSKIVGGSRILHLKYDSNQTGHAAYGYEISI